MALSETAELVATLTLKDAQFAAGAKRAGASLKGLQSRFAGMGKHVAATTRNLKILGAGVIAVGVVAFKWAADFEEQLNTINTVAGVTPRELAKIGDGIKDLAQETGTTTRDLTSAYYDLVSAGVKAADAQDILTQANTLAIGGLSTTQEAVDLLTTAINSYGLEAKDAERITDGFAQTIAAGKVTAAELAASFAKVAPIAADAGIEIEELQAAYALLTAKGIPAAEATTYMRSAIVALQKPTDSLRQVQEELGVNFAEMARDRGLVFTYNEIAKAAKRTGVPMIEMTGRIEGAAFATNTTRRNFAKYREELGKVRGAEGEAGRQLAERQKGVNASVRRLRETARVVAITFGEGLLPGAAKGFDAIARKVRSSRKAIKEFGQTAGRIVEDFFSDSFVSGPDQGSVTKVASPFEKLATTVSGAFDGISQLPWDEIKGHFTFVSRVASEALRLFTGLPPGLQSAVITLLAANKLTGGGVVAMGGLATELGKLVLGGLRTITAANVTVIGANVTSSGGGTPIPGGGRSTGTPRAPTGSRLPGGVAGGAALLSLALLVDSLTGGSQETYDVNDPKMQRIMASDPGSREKALAWQAKHWGELKTATGKLGLGNQIVSAVRDRVQAARDKVQELVNQQPIQNSLLDGISAGVKETEDAFRGESRAASEKAAVDARRNHATARLALNATIRSLPLIGSVRGAALATAAAVRAQDLSVRVAVTTNVTATTVAEGINRAVIGNRWVAT